MGQPKAPGPAKLFIAMLASDPSMFEICSGRLRHEYGPVDMESMVSPWEFTDYYAREMGRGLLRKFIFFDELISPDRLASIKNLTNELEIETSIKSSGEKRRKINLDPGYLTEAKVVLASTKDYYHRLYIGENIYAEVALRYRGSSFEPLEHTYPDYRTKEYIQMFNEARELLRNKLKKETKKAFHSSRQR